MEDNLDSISNTNDVLNYYLLVDENNFDFFRVPEHDFETMFEPVENPKKKKTYQFTQKTKDNEMTYFSLDTYICECMFSHARSDWRVGKKPFIIIYTLNTIIHFIYYDCIRTENISHIKMLHL